MPDQTSHVRHHHSLVADLERRLLIAIAKRLPPAVGSDHLSLLGLAGIVLTGACFAALRVTPHAVWGVPLALFVNWFGDSLDGTVARVRDRQRPRYGYYVDHVIDIIGTTALMGGLACSPLISPVLALALLSAYLLLCAESYLSTHVVGIFRISHGGVGPTELRVILAVGALKAAASPFVDVPALGEWRLFDIGAIVALVGMGTVFLAAAARTTYALYLAEPLPAERRRS
jgi:archaetidylinositol phosphate synthase